jgi:hypothetical protein
MNRVIEALTPNMTPIVAGLAFIALGAGMGNSNGRISAEPYVTAARDANVCAIDLEYLKKGGPVPASCDYVDLTRANIKDADSNVPQPDRAARLVALASDAAYDQASTVYRRELKTALYGFVAIWAALAVVIAIPGPPRRPS